MRCLRRSRFVRGVVLSLTLPVIGAALVGCAARSPASSESGSRVFPLSVAINDIVVGISVGDIVGQRTVRDSAFVHRQCWSYSWGPQLKATLARQTDVQQGDSLQFEVIEGLDDPFQLGGVITDLWFESSNEIATTRRWQSQCYSRAARSVSARLTVRWELFDNRRGEVVYRTTTSGMSSGNSFGAATEDAVWDAQGKLLEDEELLNLLSG